MTNVIRCLLMGVLVAGLAIRAECSDAPKKLLVVTDTKGFRHNPTKDKPANDVAKPIPFTLAKPDKPLILLETMVNDQGPFRFVLDTGAGGTVVTPELASKLGINSDEKGIATGAGGNVEVRHATVASLKVGPTQLNKLDVTIMDLTVIRKVVETDIDGLIGYNFLKNFRVTIDYPQHTVTFEVSATKE